MTETVLFLIILVYIVIQLGMNLWTMKKMKDIMDNLEEK